VSTRPVPEPCPLPGQVELIEPPEEPDDGEQIEVSRERRSRWWRTRRGIPVVQQLTEMDCSAACLAMVLGHHGRSVRLDELREVMGLDRDGATALAIVDAARHYGLRGRAVTLEIEDLHFLGCGAILHWEFKHFVVLDRVHRDAVDLIDPAFGRRRVPLEQFRKSFTGVALLFEPLADFSPGRTDAEPLRRYLRLLLGRTGQWSGILLMSLLLQALALSLPILTGALVDRVVPRADHHLLLILTVGLAVTVLFSFLGSVVRSQILLHLRIGMDAQMTMRFMEHLVALPYSFFQKRSAGDLLMRLNSNATIREILTSSAMSGVLDGALVSLYLLLLMTMNRAMGGLALGLGVLEVLVFLATRKRTRELMSQGLASQALCQSYQIEMLAGIETLKAMGSERRAAGHWSNLFVDTLNVSLARGRLDSWVDALLGTLRLGAPIAILLTGATLVLHGQLTLGTMLALNVLATAFLGPLGNLVGTAGQLQLLGSYIERLDDVVRAAPEQPAGKLRSAPTLAGRIALENVSFRYGPSAPLVVRDVSLRVDPGQFVAIVGRSGSGKSTLASLLLALYPPSGGRILYDGLDLGVLEVHSVRQQFGIVTQRPYLFGATVRANIALSDPSLPLEQVVEAARLAQIHEEIMEMGLGYNTHLFDGGATLSGGQRQRIALARALVRRPAVLLLDEATSALDAITEVRVQEALAQLRCTRVVIAHRLSTIVDADLILVMDEGRIVERGVHRDLLARGGAYAELVASQLGRDLPEMC
jgi:ATP-binding cassette subfamily B protein